MRKTKIVCTLGPATNSAEKISQLITAGMNVARLNFSHGSQQSHQQMIKLIRQISAELNQPVAILQDLQGPKLRVGKIKSGRVSLKPGAEIKIVTEDIIGDATIISTSYKDLATDVQKDDLILLDDGLIRLKVLSAGTNFVNCLIVEGGILSDHKGLNLPGVRISQPSLTEKDKQDLQFGISQDVDLVAISFVRSADDVQEVKKIISQFNKDILVIAKLEKPEAIADLENIIEKADGVMIARGDLGVEMPLEQVPILQKKIITSCRQQGKPVITATQMLESMRETSRPTRAEVSDVANAILDGTDAVMLSAETATGKYPVETVTMMHKIICATEQTLFERHRFHVHSKQASQSIADAVSNSACDAAEQLNVKAIVAFTTSGFTARMVAKYRPQTDIIAFTSNQTVARQLSLSWGINSRYLDYLENTDEIIQYSEKALLKYDYVKKGDLIVVLLGAPVFVKGTTNLMKIHVVGE